MTPSPEGPLASPVDGDCVVFLRYGNVPVDAGGVGGGAIDARTVRGRSAGTCAPSVSGALVDALNGEVATGVTCDGAVDTGVVG